MANLPELSELERSRAAVAIACLEWLRCTGPAIQPGPSHLTSPVVAEILRNPSLNVRPVPNLEPTHPLWDRWLDG